MHFTDDSGEEIKYFSKTKIDQNKHLETVKLLQCLLANSLQGCLGMKQDLSFCCCSELLHVPVPQVRREQTRGVSHMITTAETFRVLGSFSHKTFKTARKISAPSQVPAEEFLQNTWIMLFFQGAC